MISLRGVTGVIFNKSTESAFERKAVPKFNTFAPTRQPIKRCQKGPVVQLDRISDSDSEGYRFESCRGHSRFSESLHYLRIWRLFDCMVVHLVVHFFKYLEKR